MQLEKLKEPFAPSDISWRIGQAGKKANGEVWAKVLAYIDNRCVQERLDEVCGPANWANEYRAGPGGGVICGISINVDPGVGLWVTKWDGAENSDIEEVKGGLSDAMKRAAVQWGIGRYLYEMGETWADVVDRSAPGARYAKCKIKVGGKEDWVEFYWTPPRLREPPPPPKKNDPPAPEPQPDERSKFAEYLSKATDDEKLGKLCEWTNKRANSSLLNEWFVAITAEADLALLDQLEKFASKNKPAFDERDFTKLGVRLDARRDALKA